MARHHIVPQSALKRFATTSNRIVAIDRTAGRRFETTAKSACAEVGFYTIPTEDLEDHAQSEHDPEMVERILSGIESDTKVIVDRILDGEFPPPARSRFTLSLFLATQMTRGWAFREQFNELSDSLLPHYLETILTDEKIIAFLSKEGRRSDADAIEAFRSETLRNPPRLRMTHAAMVQQSLKLALHEATERLYLRSWRVLEFASSRLLTSDHPFGYWSSQGDHDGAFGFANAPVIFHPLNRQTALTMSLKRIPEVVLSSGTTRARQINSSVAGEASKWIFHHPDDDPLGGLTIPPKGRFVDEVVGQRIDANGNFRELHRLVRRTDPVDEV